MKLILFIYLLTTPFIVFSQVKYMDEDAVGNWIWNEVVEYDTSSVDPELIVNNMAD